MEAMSSSVNSSDEENFIVGRRPAALSSSRRKVLADSSDEDDEPKPQNVISKTTQSSSSESTPVKSQDSNISTKSNQGSSDCDRSDAVITTNKKKFTKRRIIQKKSDSEGDSENSRNAINVGSQIDTHTELANSDTNLKDYNKSRKKRVKRKDKMMEKIRKTFDKHEVLPREEINKIAQPLLSLCDRSSSSDDDKEEKFTESLSDIKNSHSKEDLKCKTSYKSTMQDQRKIKVTTAKDAMENMTKIKSESTRMLREKRVSLPYHRPRQLKLKDILSRKRPDIPSENKPLSFKMNRQQLEQYAIQLEESQKHMSELYRSDEEDDQSTGEGLDDNRDNLNPKINSEESLKDEYNKNAKADTLFDDCTNLKMTGTDNYSGNTLDATTGDFTSEILCDNKELEDKPKETEITAELPVVYDSKDDSQNIKLHYSENSENIIHSINANDSVLEKQIIDHKKELINDKICAAEAAIVEDVTEEICNILINNQESEVHVNKSMINLLENSTTEDENSKIQVQGVVSTTNENVTLKLNSSESSEIENSEKLSYVDLKVANDYDCDIPKKGSNIVLLDSDKDKDNPSANSITIHEDINSQNVKKQNVSEPSFCDDFGDDEFESMMDQIEKENDFDVDSSPMLVHDVPQLKGAPGMVIDLDAPVQFQKKLSGVEILKQRFIYFSQMRTPEEKEREKENKIKPGAKHLMLKQELEKQISEERIAEWTKRLEEEQKKEKERIVMNGELSDCEDELEKMEKKIKDTDNTSEKNGIADEEGDSNDVSSESGDEQNEDDIKLQSGDEDIEGGLPDKTLTSIKKQNKNHNFLIDDEAEVDDDCDDVDDNEEEIEEPNETSDENSSSSEQEENENKKPKKGRIIKAFEDSDDENQSGNTKITDKNNVDIDQNCGKHMTPDLFESEGDLDIPLAQRVANSFEEANISFDEHAKETTNKELVTTMKLLGDKMQSEETDHNVVISEDPCSGKFLSNSDPELPEVPPSIPKLQMDSEVSTQIIGEDILQLCSGRFDEDVIITQSMNYTNLSDVLHKPTESQNLSSENDKSIAVSSELPKTNSKSTSSKYFEHNFDKENVTEPETIENGFQKAGKLIIESSDEEDEQKSKKRKKKKTKKRIFLVSDDEEDDDEAEDSECDSDLEEPGDDVERIVEYDSEENEVEILPSKTSSKRMASRFMEQEAELTSEDEWAGSGDEDERGLDRMEREAGDDDVFHQGRLRRELEQMHMQDLMDKDKHEVRLLQEILLEDGDLEGGSRQRKFRWKNQDEEAATGSLPDDLVDGADEDRETEEWRKQRHDRQVFLRQLAEKQKSDDDILGLGSAESPLITNSVLPRNANNSVENPGGTEVKPAEKKLSKELPSPVKNSFTIMQQQYLAVVSERGSSQLVHSTLRRLAELVEPPAERQVAAGTAKRSFVFATLTQEPADDIEGTEHKSTQKKKRKAEAVSSPKLIKKLRAQEKPRTSLLHQLD